MEFLNHFQAAAILADFFAKGLHLVLERAQCYSLMLEQEKT